MSTPSTIATTIVPAHYGYPHQNPYSPSALPYPATNTLPAPQRLTTSYHSYPTAAQYPRPQPSPASYRPPSNVSSMAPSQTASTLPDNQRRKQPDWNEFYKNGVPKEIIVIDDDSPEPNHTGNASGQQQQADAYGASGRKRKVDQGYEIEYTDSPTYSTHPAKFGGSSSSAASYHSGGRTTSLQTVTAPTSLESYGSNPASTSYEDVRTGQKRKRAQPQKETRAQTKRRQQETTDAFADYIPPPKPAKKAPDVHVPVIRDVCLPWARFDFEHLADKVADSAQTPKGGR